MPNIEILKMKNLYENDMKKKKLINLWPKLLPFKSCLKNLTEIIQK